MKPCDVLIAGAGPTGLVLAIWLTKQGVPVRIIDRTKGPGTTSRAMAVQCRTLELYRQLDLAQPIVGASNDARGVNLWVRGEKKAHISLEDVGADLTPFGFMHIFPQDQHERLLVAKLEELGVSVERNTELLSFAETAEGISATLKHVDGAEEEVLAKYIAGCDGASSLVRKTTGIGFPGGTYQQIFYVADVEGTGDAFNGELNIDLDKTDFVAIFPMKSGGGRLIGTVKDKPDHQEELKFEDISHQAIDGLKLDIQKVNWFSTYHVHHRVADHFRKGRAFLLGDAAHVHSPAGGQGMNTGIGDAINLAWKLKAVLKDQAPDSLLDSFEAERIVFARRLVATTDRAFGFITADGPIAQLIRTRMAPIVMPEIAHFDVFKDFIFKTVSQTALNYRDGPLSKGKAGKTEGGDRLPWTGKDADNQVPLSAITWQIHVYGAPKPEVTAWCQAHDLPLHVFEWREEYEDIGLEQDALYLMRPDSYVALADAAGSIEAIKNYFAETRIMPQPSLA